MTTPNLAKIERVDLREAWPNEAQDFTPWLAENIAELGEALGMDLELQQTEAAVGGYSLDMLATDQNQNRTVIIENQLEATNHDHLGKLLTYAAGYDANVIVWLTREFRDEHRLALDWLNQRTGDDTQFFGVVVEVWKIDNSRPAPHFNLVVTPNEWRKRMNEAAPPLPSMKNPFPWCLCGCGGENSPGSKFKQGHDAKLKSRLSKVKGDKLGRDDLPGVLIEAFLTNPNLRVVGYTAEDDIFNIIGNDKEPEPEIDPAEHEEPQPKS